MTDVVVVGGGPVGLALACALAHHGVEVRLVDDRAGPSAHSKAHNLWARPQELLAAVGALDPIAAQGYAISFVNVLLDRRAVARVPVDRDPSPRAAPIYTGQDVIERCLAETATQRGVSIERGRAAQRIEQDADGVTVTVAPTGGDGPQEQIRCRYLVGADGSSGVTGQAVGLPIPLERFTRRATRQLDARLSWQRPTVPEELWFFLYRHGFAGVMPVWGGYHRLFFIESDRVVPDRDPTLEEVQDRAREVTGDASLTLSDPVWASHGRFQHGVADAYARGRVFLVGDAGHHTLPIGGQGMNAGLHDAVGLAWRLAMTLAGHTGPAVLESYSSERRGAHAALDADQARGFRWLVYRGRTTSAMLRAASHLVRNFGSRVLIGDDLQQLGVSYPASPLSEDHLGRRGPRAGDRAPDARLVGVDGPTTLFEQLYNPDGHTWGWCLLAFDGGRRRRGDPLRAGIAAVTGHRWVHPRLVLANSAAASHTGPHTLADLDRTAHTAYGLGRTPTFVLVRPDGHIAFRGPVSRPELLTAACDRISGANFSANPHSAPCKR